MASKDSTACPVLENAKDFQIWQIRIIGKLRREKVYDVLFKERPDETSPSVYPPTSAATTTHQDTWDVRDAKAHGIITDHICDRLALATTSEKTAADLYNKLVDMHQNQNVGASAFYTFIEMLETKWDGSPETIQDHIAKLAAADSKLVAMKKPMDAEFLAFMLLHSLPEDPIWEMFKTSVLNALPKDTKATFSDIADRLVFDSLRKQGAESALKAKPMKPKLGSKNMDLYCTFHKINGHDTSNCYKLKQKEQGKEEKRKEKRKGRRKETANKSSHDTASESDSSSSDSDSTPNVKVSKSLMTRIQAYALTATKPNEGRELQKVIVLDSGASAHMTPRRDWFLAHSFKKLTPARQVSFGDNSSVPATGIGSVTFRQTLNGRDTEITVHNVLFVPAFTLTLLSVRKFNNAGFYSVFKGKKCHIKSEKTNEEILEGQVKRDLYQLGCEAVAQVEDEHPGTERSSEPTHDYALSANVDINTLHRRWGHISMPRLKKMVENGQIQDIVGVTGTQKFCEPCVLGKMKKMPFKHEGQRASAPLEVIHSDVGGPVTPADRHGHRYWITFIDDNSRFPWVYFLKQKSEALPIFRQWKKDVQDYFKTEIGEVLPSEGFLSFFQTDGGGEYLSREFEKELNITGTVHHTTAADTPEQNGIAERMNQTLVNLATTMLLDSKMPKSYWTDAMSTAAYLLARAPSADRSDTLPYKSVFKREVDGSWFRPFGSKGYALIPKDKRNGKFGAKGRKCILLGYTSGKKAYKLLDVQTRVVFHSRHVRFDEDTEAVDVPDGDPLDKLPAQWEELKHGKSFMQPSRRKPTVSTNDADDSGSTSSDSDSDDERPPQTKHVAEDEQADPDVPSTPPRTQTRPAPPPAPTRRVKTKSVLTSGTVGEERPKRVRIVPNKYGDYERAIKLQADAKLRSKQAKSSAQGPTTADGTDAEPIVPANETAEPIAGDAPQLADSHEPRPSMNTLIDIADDEQTDSDAVYFAGISNVGPNVALTANDSITPRSTEEAFNGPDSSKWEAALAEELQSLVDNNVYEIVEIPKHARPITSKIVMRTKLDGHGNVERHKIRIVARGFTQKEGIDYQEVFAPVANLESIRIIIALAAKYNLELDQMDVSTAYLNGELTEELYLTPPKEVAIPDGCCWRLKRSLYGLKQAGRTWNHTLDKKLREMHFTRLNAETCLYVYREESGQLCFLVVYVDDFILAATSRTFMNKVKAMLSSAFKMKDLGPASYILGIQIIRDRANRTISLSQSQYCETVVERCGMKDCKPIWTPMEPGLHLTIDDPTSGADNTVVFEMNINGKHVSYASVIGSLGYAVAGTRPDLAYTVSVLGRFSSCPKAHHWKAAKRALRYLRATSNMVLRFDGRDVGMDMDFKIHNDFTFHGYSDADWSGCPDTSKSTSGFTFITARGAIGWGSKLQTMVSLSSTESEYIGLCNAAQHLAWLRTFFEDIGQKQKEPTKLYCDNQAAIILSKDPQFRARTKHIQRKYHFIRDDIVTKGEAVVIYVPTEDMVADVLTKSLSHEKHWKFTKAMGLRLDASGSVKVV